MIETLTPLIQLRRELRTDSGGAGRFRGGLGQASEMACRSDRPWSVSALVDRTRFPAAGIAGGGAGGLGELSLSSSEPVQPKSVVSLAPEARIRLAPPGGGGYGDPRQRDPEGVLADVVDGYVSIERAREDYGVAVQYVGPIDRLVRTPDLYRIDWEETRRLRGTDAIAR